jgi:hypothetical protein
MIVQIRPRVTYIIFRASDAVAKSLVTDVMQWTSNIASTDGALL